MIKTNVVIPMAGAGTRFHEYSCAKPFLPLGSQSMIEAVIQNLNSEGFFFTFVIRPQAANLKKLEKIFNQCLDDFEIVETPVLPCGPAASSMLAMESIDLSLPLILTNCDQIIEDFNASYLQNFCDTTQADGVLGMFHSLSPKNSYVKLDSNNRVVEVKEKEVISNMATNGLHWWKCASSFVLSFQQMEANKDTVNNEYYIAPSYKYMAQQGLKVLPFWYNMHYPVGIPEDYEYYKKLRNL